MRASPRWRRDVRDHAAAAGWRTSSSRAIGSHGRMPAGCGSLPLRASLSSVGVAIRRGGLPFRSTSSHYVDPDTAHEIAESGHDLFRFDVALETRRSVISGAAVETAL
jgi:hypothetical protein